MRLTDFSFTSSAFPLSSFRAKARNLFRSRSGESGEEGGKRETPCSMRLGRMVLHADSITKENGNGKRKRSLGCARDDETGKGISHISFQPIAEANLRPFGAPPSRGRRENAGFPYSKSFSRIVIPKSPSVLWYNMTRRMTRS